MPRISRRISFFKLKFFYNRRMWKNYASGILSNHFLPDPIFSQTARASNFSLLNIRKNFKFSTFVAWFYFATLHASNKNVLSYEFCVPGVLKI